MAIDKQASHMPHPLSPLSSAEITQSATLIHASLPGNPDVQFKAITLDEPPKAVMIPYLEAEHDGKAEKPAVQRKAFISYYIRNTDKLHEAIVNLTNDQVESNVRVPAEFHAPADGGELITVEEHIFKSAKVQAELQALELPPDTKFICDPWIYGSDGLDDQKRMFQTYIYMRDPKNNSYADSNHYAYPLPISPVLDGATLEVIRIDRLPTGKGLTTKPMTKMTKIHPPSEYMPEFQTLRADLKPLNVVQPEGASFTATKLGQSMELIEWQKWSFKIGFNQREGPVLYDVRYDHRNLFYRMALSDMSIPYADPRTPFHRKEAFDLGDVGAGIMANNLQLGCDCLGTIHYIDGLVMDDRGNPDPRPNAICIHEQDNGILWKHTNYRTERAAIVRNRELVIQTIITVANYEYILAYIFSQAGEITYEVRATGVVSTQPIDEDISVPWGTVVHPGVLATHHQHIFSLRVDPAIDGYNNTLVKSETRPMPINTKYNPHGNGYFVQDSVVPTSGGFDLDESVNRTFKITNPHSRNPINGKTVAYKIQAPVFQKIIAHPTSFHSRRAEFANHNIYVTQYREGELYAGGKYTNQSRGGHGVRGWAERADDITGGTMSTDVDKANGTNGTGSTDQINGTNGTGSHGLFNGTNGTKEAVTTNLINGVKKAASNGHASGPNAEASIKDTATAESEALTDGIPTDFFANANPDTAHKGSDIVLWIQFGLQHIVRAEDWPVMPAETLSVKFKPVNFFKQNPAMDVPPSAQISNQSVLACRRNHLDLDGNDAAHENAAKHLQGSVEGTAFGLA